MASSSSSPSFFTRHEFLILRLQSLCGLFPVGMYMVVHLLTNASILAGAPAFQKNVDAIHALGPALPLIEWTFIFLPIIFHAVVGVMIIRSGKTNSSRYQYSGNIRYTLQRATAWIALVFIFWHVFQMHGWIKNEYWLENLAKPLHGAAFDPEHASSSVARAMIQWPVRIVYAIGVGSCVFHFANGLWTMGITWGVWQSAAAQRRANWLCGTIGVLVFIIGMGAWVGAMRVDMTDAHAYELTQIEKKEAELKEEERIKEELRENHRKAQEQTSALPVDRDRAASAATTTP